MRYLKKQVSHCQLEKRQYFQMLRKDEPISVDANWLRRGVQDQTLTVFKGRFGGFSGGIWWHMDVQDKDTQVWRAGLAAGGRERLAGAWGSGRTRFENMTPGRKFWCFQNVQMSMIFKHHTFSIIFLDCMLIFPAVLKHPWALGAPGSGGPRGHRGWGHRALQVRAAHLWWSHWGGTRGALLDHKWALQTPKNPIIK